MTVAGRRYGKGSSREHSPAAEKLAGIRLVIARSFERIYRQNADNIGLFTSTDFGLVERIERGEAIPLDELLAGRDALAAGILRSGGLLRFGQAICARRVRRSRPPARGPARCSRRSSQAPAGHAGHHADPPRAKAPSCAPTGASSTSTTPAWPRTCCTARSADRWHCTSRIPSSCSRTTPRTWTRVPPTCAPAWCRTCGPCARPSATSPRTSACARTARSPMRKRARRRQQHRRHLARHDGRALRAAGPGGGRHRFAHAAQRRARLLAFGVGTTDMANAFVTGAVRMTMPQVLRVELDGDVPRRRDRQGHRAAPAGAAGDPRRRWRRQGVRVRG